MLTKQSIVALPYGSVVKGMVHTYYNCQLYSTTIDISNLPYKTSGAGDLRPSTYGVSD